MNVVAISCVKNELDIIEAFVRHTVALVDRLVVMDNGSTDGTLDVLRSLEREGLPLEVVEDNSPGYWQMQRMTRLMRDYAVGRHAADWVVPLDADEFLVVADGARLLSAEEPSEQPLHVPWKTYTPTPQDDPAERNPVIRIQHRLLAESKGRFKAIVPGALARQVGARFSQGSHQFLLGDEVPEHRLLVHAHLAHFPGRSVAQLMAKIAVGFLQYQAMHDKDPRWGAHYEAPFRLMQTDPAAFADSFYEMVVRYAQPVGAAFDPQFVIDPCPYAGGPLRYLPAASAGADALPAIVSYSVALAQRFAEASDRAAELVRAHEQATQVHSRTVAELQARLAGLEHRYRQDVAALESDRADLAARLSDSEQLRQREIEEMQRSLAALRASRTWRVGRAIVGPTSRLLRPFVAQRAAGAGVETSADEPAAASAASPESIEAGLSPRHTLPGPHTEYRNLITAPNSGVPGLRALVAGWFSLPTAPSTAGDLIAGEVVHGWLRERGVPCDMALAAPNGSFDWRTVDPAPYTHFVFVCGPFAQDCIPEFRARFAHCRTIGVNLSMIDGSNPFDVLFARDGQPDIVFAGTTKAVPLVGLVLIHPQPEYGERSQAAAANQALQELALSRSCVPISIDTRLDGHNATHLRTPAEVESAIARMDLVLTTRLHGLVLALKNGVPVVAVDSVSGGAKVTAQGQAVGWPVHSIDRLDSAELARAFDDCLSVEARARARHCAAAAARQVEELRTRFLNLPMLGTVHTA